VLHNLLQQQITQKWGNKRLICIIEEKAGLPVSTRLFFNIGPRQLRLKRGAAELSSNSSSQCGKSRPGIDWLVGSCPACQQLTVKQKR